MAAALVVVLSLCGLCGSALSPGPDWMWNSHLHVSIVLVYSTDVSCLRAQDETGNRDPGVYLYVVFGKKL